MYSSRAAIIIANQFVHECVQNGLKVDKAFLFGSYSRNEQHKWSDIDLALVSANFTSNFLENSHLTLDAKIKYPDVEVHAFSVEDFTEENPFVKEIIKTGIPLTGEPLLTSEELESKLREMKPFLVKQFKVRNIGFFGSFATGKATEESDIDIIVDFSEPPGYEFFDLEDLLEGTFHRKIDLVSKNALHKYLKDRILNETIYV